MGAANLLVGVESSRPLYKKPANVGAPASAKSGTEPEWDIVIIGGGSAGCILASRYAKTAVFIYATCSDRLLLVMFVLLESRSVLT